jgi:hypothetical protein
MTGITTRCAGCGQARDPLPIGSRTPEGACPTCGAPLDGAALAEFANRLAQFGLGATRQPLLSRVPELPDAK